MTSPRSISVHFEWVDFLYLNSGRLTSSWEAHLYIITVSVLQGCASLCPSSAYPARRLLPPPEREVNGHMWNAVSSSVSPRGMHLHR